jgi:hypothetical protein
VLGRALRIISTCVSRAELLKLIKVDSIALSECDLEDILVSGFYVQLVIAFQQLRG